MPIKSFSELVELPLSRRVVQFLLIWLFAWPLVVAVYNPLTKPYEPLTLLLVVPGGAVWLFSFLLSCFFVCNALFYLAAELWPPATKIRKAFGSLVEGLLWLLPF